MRSTLPCFLLGADLQLRSGAGQPRRFGAGSARFGKLVNQVLKRHGGPRIAKTPEFAGKAAAPHASATACGRTLSRMSQI
jgi:hypothetical protein